MDWRKSSQSCPDLRFCDDNEVKEVAHLSFPSSYVKWKQPGLLHRDHTWMKRGDTGAMLCDKRACEVMFPVLTKGEVQGRKPFKDDW